MSGLTQIAKQAGERRESNFSEHDRPSWDLYSTCIHCGLCLNHCPTYRVLGVEMDSPRGRIYQVLQVDEGRMPLGESFATHIDRCLGCLACETACPSGVHYGAIVERARAQIEQRYRRPLLERLTRDFFFQRVLAKPRLMEMLARMLRWYQSSAVRRALRKSGVLKMMALEGVEALAPKVDDEPFFSAEVGKVFAASGAKRERVAFHAGCIQNVAFSELNRATVRVLQACGAEVSIFAEQACCGALQAHAGYRDSSREQARRNIAAIEKAEAEHGPFAAIISNAAGCGAHLKDYPDLLREDAEFAERAVKFSAKMRDVTEYVAAVGVAGLSAAPMKVTYQDPCHLAHAQKVRSAPRELLRAAGCELMEMPHPEICCGSAGVYNVTQNELSMQVLAQKMDDVQSVASGVEAIVTANVGCMMQLRAGVQSRGLNLPVLHVVEVLDRALAKKPQS